jgi:heme-degrading monooxygenase HmoA
MMAVKILIKRKVSESITKDLMPLFARLRNLATTQPGYISGETLKRLDETGEYLVISTWQSIDNWREYVVSRERNEIQSEIDARLSADTTYEIYQYG